MLLLCQILDHLIRTQKKYFCSSLIEFNWFFNFPITYYIWESYFAKYPIYLPETIVIFREYPMFCRHERWKVLYVSSFQTYSWSPIDQKCLFQAKSKDNKKFGVQPKTVESMKFEFYRTDPNKKKVSFDTTPIFRLCTNFLCFCSKKNTLIVRSEFFIFCTL